MSIIYRGFSTRVNVKKYTLTDFDLAKQDLINYFYIRKGEKLMQPKFGTIIWDMLFEPLTEDTQQTITDDITRIVSYDPRLAVSQVAIHQQNDGFMIEITLSYVPNNQVETLRLNFERDSKTLTIN